MLAGRRVVFTIILGLSVAASSALPEAQAQTLPSVPQSLLDQLQRQQGQGQGQGEGLGQNSGEISVQQPLQTPQNRGGRTGQQNYYDNGTSQSQGDAPARLQQRNEQPATPLEQDYSSRASTPLRLFGRDVFSRPSGAAGMVTGTIRDSYVMGFGDEIVVTLRGQVSRSYRTRVGRDGQVVLPDLPPVPAVGRSFGDFRADLESVVKRVAGRGSPDHRVGDG
jgi:hypothetical protein